jgi:hypothetical protein
MTTSESRSRVLGVTGAVVLARRVEESSCGRFATTTEEIACIRSGVFHRRVRVAWTKDFMTGNENNKIISDDPISESEYLTAYKNHPLTNLRDDLRDELNQLRPVCSACEAGMELKQGPSSEFWGCPFFPKCRGKTRNLSIVFRRKLEEARKVGVIFY